MVTPPSEVLDLIGQQAKALAAVKQDIRAIGLWHSGHLRRLDALESRVMTLTTLVVRRTVWSRLRWLFTGR